MAQYEGWNNDQITAYLADDEHGNLIQYNQDINHIKIGYYAYKDINQLMRFDRKLLKTALAKYNVEIIKEFYDKTTKLDLAKVKSDEESYLDEINEVLEAIEYKTGYGGLNRKLVSRVFEVSKLEPDFNKVRAYFLNEYRPGCKTHQKKLLELNFKNVNGNSKAATFKRILINSLDQTKTYSIEELKYKVMNASQLSGMKIQKGKEIYTLDALVIKERTSVMEDGKLINVYKIMQIIV